VFEKASDLGPAHPATIDLVWSLGVSLHHSRRLAEAEAVFRRGIAAAEKSLGPEHPDTGLLVKWLGINLRAQRRPAEAEPSFRRALAICRAVAPRDAVTADAAVQHGGALETLGRNEEAVQAYREGVQILEALGASERKELVAAPQGLARALRAAGRPAEAKEVENRLRSLASDATRSP
jgi:tetratricopeptide (TPR) repeat protein